MLDDFVIKYSTLPEYKAWYYKYDHYIYDFRPRFWNIKSSQILKDSKGQLEEFDFYWKAMLFSLLSKILYKYSPENYIYCKDFLNWKFENDILNYINKNKLSFFLDNTLEKIERISELQVREYSIENIDSYLDWYVNLITLFNDECCITNLHDKVVKASSDKYFLDEFSENDNSLSNQFLKSYLKKIC